MSASGKFSFAIASHQGLLRRENQDAWGKFPENSSDGQDPRGHFFVIADGLGGHLGGKVASALAVQTLGEFFQRQPDLPIADFWRRAYETASERIFVKGLETAELHGMGTTCAALLVNSGCYSFANVGDSRIYRLRRRRLQQLTTDHTLQQEPPPSGLFSRHGGEAPKRVSIITRALGTQPFIEVDYETDLPIEEGDCFILCTDGLYNEVDEATIQQVAQNDPPEAACQKLIALANANGGRDNITVGIIKFGAPALPDVSTIAASKSAVRPRWWWRLWNKARDFRKY